MQIDVVNVFFSTTTENLKIQNFPSFFVHKGHTGINHTYSTRPSKDPFSFPQSFFLGRLAVCTFFSPSLIEAMKQVLPS